MSQTLRAVALMSSLSLLGLGSQAMTPGPYNIPPPTSYYYSFNLDSAAFAEGPPTQLPPVQITGHYCVNDFACSSLLSELNGQFNQFGLPYFQKFNGEPNLPSINPKSSDVRCNPLVSGDSKNTTSRSSATDRYFAAAEDFNAIVLSDATKAAAKAATARSIPYLNSAGKLVPTFTVTLADGGTERYQVEYVGTQPRLTIDANVPNSLVLQNGVPTGCPI